MDKYSTLGTLCKREIRNHSEQLSEGLSRPKQKLISQMMYGRSYSQSCKLTEIGRSFKETIGIKRRLNVFAWVWQNLLKCLKLCSGM